MGCAGVFIERVSDLHVARRAALLDGGGPLPGPRRVINARGKNALDQFRDVFKNELESTGLLVAQLDEPMSTPQFVTFGALMGTAIEEHDDAVQPYVEAGSVLNLVSDQGRTNNVLLQPFASRALTLHTESSGR